jgi:hypothetical protein
VHILKFQSEAQHLKNCILTSMNDWSLMIEALALDVAKDLEASLQSRLVSSNRRLILEPSSPDLLFNCFLNLELVSC